MRNLSPNEILTLSKMLQMETNGLAIAKAGINIVNDEQLKTLTKSGIAAAEGRIRTIQQFANENNISTVEQNYAVREEVQ
jgi:hypothetical protein